MTTLATGEFPPQRREAGSPILESFAPLAGSLERAAAAIARLDTLLTGHPLAAAWVWRSRLEAAPSRCSCCAIWVQQAL